MAVALAWRVECLTDNFACVLDLHFALLSRMVIVGQRLEMHVTVLHRKLILESGYCCTANFKCELQCCCLVSNWAKTRF
jgi:hypothetical protein